jgi:CheY-like chemotaxis protein
MLSRERSVRSQWGRSDRRRPHRIISGKLRLDIQPINLVPVIHAAVESLRTAADAKGVNIHMLLDPAAGTVSGDISRLQQVVWNLLSNAIKFTPKGGRITLALSREKQYAQIAVMDTGQGIAREFLPHVFERFRQADPSSRRAQGGLGLGLAIVRHLIELQGGTVTAKSDGVGQGATFTVQLPSVLSAMSQTGETKSPRVREGQNDEPRCDLHNVRVLLIDDERDTREIISRAFRDSGATVAVGASVEQALELFEKLNPDVMISDIGMPGQDGFDLIRQIREFEEKKGPGRVPAIALTAFARDEDRQRTKLAGFQMHVAKPVVPSELIDIVVDLVFKSH